MQEDDEVVEQTTTDTDTDTGTDTGTETTDGAVTNEIPEVTSAPDRATTQPETPTSTNERVEVNEDQDVNVGGEQQEEEPATTEIRESEELPKKTGELGNSQQEDESHKRERKKFEPIKDQDISQYLWDQFLKFLNWVLDKFDEKLMAALDHVIDNMKCNNIERSNDVKKDIPHAQKRGKELLNGGETFSAAFVGSLDNRMLDNYGFVAQSPEKMKEILGRAAKISFDTSASRYLHDVMANDTKLEFAYMDNAKLKKKIEKPMLSGFHDVMIGVASTALAAEDYLRASGITDEAEIARKKAAAVEAYLTVMETQAAKVKNMTEQNLGAANFAANDKSPDANLRVEVNKMMGALDKSQLFGRQYVAAVDKTAKKNKSSIKKDLKQELKERLKVPNNGNKTLVQLSLIGADLSAQHELAVRRRETMRKFREDIARGGREPANKFTIDKSLDKSPQRSVINDLLGGRIH